LSNDPATVFDRPVRQTDQARLTIHHLVARTWILQSNPKLYDIDTALHQRPVIYWRTPQFFE
jgi:hypothetical protein